MSSIFASPRGVPSTLPASLNSRARSSSHTVLTAEPTLDTVQEPPSTGEYTMDESPSLKVTSSMATPENSAAIMVITV